MRIANVDGRCAALISGDYIDIARWSDGQFEADPMALLARWSAFTEWYKDAPHPGAHLVTSGTVGPPVPRPRQVFAVASNYAGRDTVLEGSMDLPIVFTKFPSSISGPDSTLELPSSTVDWEVEMVVVIGEKSACVGVMEAWSKVAGITVGQDFSERTLQLGGVSKQFSLGKSYPGFGPIGPHLVTPDEFANRDKIKLGCSVNGETMQDGSTAQMIFPVPELVSKLSHICHLFPGDLIFTGTPGGMGMTMNPPRYLRPGDIVDSWMEDVGALSNRCLGLTMASVGV